MIDNNRRTPSRIPVRFVDEDERARQRRAASSGGDEDTNLTPDELGRASIYEDATEMQQRIDRGGEEGAAGDDRDIVGTIDPSEATENREDQDTMRRESPTEGADDPRSAHQADGPDAAAGPTMAELVATRAELRRVQGEIQKFSEERQELLERVARRQADFENYRKRVERERQESYNRVVADVVGKFLPVLDNLQRALDAEASVEAVESEGFRHFLHGVELIRKQLSGVLESLGVEAIETVGLPFDPHVHEAIATEDSADFEPDTVTAEVARGYRLGDRLLRAAMVKVAR
ncbi:MAG TPA: nucleotide exchange factor GrpE [Pyrinomonadaceae bacterium]|nr:nucleotide exchange factor GrpE [Pyrinomonadaceae bacterium]